MNDSIANLIGPCGLHAPPEVAFAMRSWLLFLPSFNLFLAQAALRAPPEVAFTMRSWPLLLPSFSLSLSLPFLSSSFAFKPLREILRVRKFVSPNIMA